MDDQGNLIKHSRKAVTAFVANYVHYMDAFVCHFVIDQLRINDTLELGTVHDSFFIKPSQKKKLTETYKLGLIKANQLHRYNMLHWLHSICTSYKPKDNSKLSIVETLKQLIQANGEFQTNNDAYVVKLLPCDELLELLKPVVKAAPALHKPKLEAICLELDTLEDSMQLQTAIQQNPGIMLFSS